MSMVFILQADVWLPDYILSTPWGCRNLGSQRINHFVGLPCNILMNNCLSCPGVWASRHHYTTVFFPRRSKSQQKRRSRFFVNSSGLCLSLGSCSFSLFVYKRLLRTSRLWYFSISWFLSSTILFLVGCRIHCVNVCCILLLWERIVPAGISIRKSSL